MASTVFTLLVLLTSTALAKPLTSGASAEGIAVANERIAQSLAEDRRESPGRVVVVYFTPRGLPPAANHVQRIRRIVEETAGFYQRELQHHGFPNRRMNVLRNQQGKIEVIDVVGAEKNYDKPDGNKIRTEAIAVLREKGIDPNSSVLLIFCNLMEYDAQQSKISHHSPYYGGGSYLSGTAWQCDSEILDPQRFQDPTPLLDGEYGKITIGRHNSIFIGGVIHELGHALSLPHCRQRSDEQARGTALMGSGNQTYAEQLRGEGLGTFLTQAHAMRLAAHPAFNRYAPASLYDHPETQWKELRIDTTERNIIRVQGTLASSVPIHAVVAYFDPTGGGDYDATTATAVTGENGQFAFRSGSLRSGAAGQLRLVACHVNGATSSREMSYRIAENGEPNLSAIRLSLELRPMLDSLRQQDLPKANEELQRISKHDAELFRIGENVLNRFSRHWNPRFESVGMALGEVPSSVESIALSRMRPISAKVGWMRPSYDRVPSRDLLLTIDGDYFASGIYAHAPSEYRYQLDGAWSRLTGRCGLQSGSKGKVDFQIRGDSQVLWKAQGAVDGKSFDFDVDVHKVKTLVLSVSDAGNGNSADWGLWIQPRLAR